MALMFSTTKGVSALAVAVAASQELITFDARVADYWPEFAQASKGRSPCVSCFHIRRGCLPLIRRRRWTMCGTRRSSRRCSRQQAPACTPGTRHGYHAVTLGWYESELIRHADPSGRSLGQFFAEEVA
jgi:CubicO group peptidase (beta-lactamase class C family)